jgi:biopolymer transport protein TolR
MAMHLGRKKPVADINVTPLVDVVLVLLIIFMVLTPLAEKQKYLRVPEDQDALLVPPEQVPPEQTVLTALANGRVLVNAEELEIGDAMRKLERAYRGRPSRPLFFNAEDRVGYEQAFKVLDAAHEAGVNTIGMVTDPPITRRSGDTPGSAAGAPAPRR